MSLSIFAGAWALKEDAIAADRGPKSVWERPLLYWLLALLVVAIAAYGYYWDAHVSTGPHKSSEIVHPQSAP